MSGLKAKTFSKAQLRAITKKVHIIGAPSGWGAQIRATEKGPEELKAVHLGDYLENSEINWNAMVYPSRRAEESQVPCGSETIPVIVDHCTRVAEEVATTIEQNAFPCVIGGDHSIAIGTWSGVTHASNAMQNFGLIWIDAHMDAHVPETSPSQAIHGMPVASLLGFGMDELKSIMSHKAKILPQHLVLIGVRSYEEGEQALLKKLNVKIFTMDDVKSLGFASVFAQAVEIVRRDTAGFGVSIDLDGFDPRFAPGVGSPEPGGLEPSEVIPILSALKTLPNFKALEIMEYNPVLDNNHMTRKLMQKLIQSILD